MTTTALSEQAKLQATVWHSNTNHLYAGYLPYSYHLNLVAEIAKKYLTAIPENKQDIVLSACYLHDTIEDARISYNYLREVFGTEVADIVFAVTNNTGKTRKDRADDAYYEKIKSTPFAGYVKACDRTANVLHGVMFRSSMLDAYRKEHAHFQEKVWDEYNDFIMRDLKLLLRSGTFSFPISKHR